MAKKVLIVSTSIRNGSNLVSSNEPFKNCS